MLSIDWRAALGQTRRSAFGRLVSLLGPSELSAQYWDELEASLLQADLGPAATQAILHDLRAAANEAGIRRGEELRRRLRESLLQQLPAVSTTQEQARPRVSLLVGVNGTGKTTAAARLAAREKALARTVLLAAADTYRAAADEQLEAWGKRLGIEVISGRAGGDPGAVVYDACHACLARNVDALYVDTSGRMHTRHNLMAELGKICRVAGKVISGAPHEVLLVIDATTGQNGLSQARSFADAAPLTGVILTKLDTSARGGVGFAVAAELGLPIRFVGLGEGVHDLVAFDGQAFVDGLLADGQPT